MLSSVFAVSDYNWFVLADLSFVNTKGPKRNQASLESTAVLKTRDDFNLKEQLQMEFTFLL